MHPKVSFVCVHVTPACFHTCNAPALQKACTTWEYVERPSCSPRPRICFTRATACGPSWSAACAFSTLKYILEACAVPTCSHIPCVPTEYREASDKGLNPANDILQNIIHDILECARCNHEAKAQHPEFTSTQGPQVQALAHEGSEYVMRNQIHYSHQRDEAIGKNCRQLRVCS